MYKGRQCQDMCIAPGEMPHFGCVAQSQYCPHCSSDVESTYDKQHQIWVMEKLRRQREHNAGSGASTTQMCQDFDKQMIDYKRKHTILTLQTDQDRRINNLKQLSYEQFCEHEPIRSETRLRKRMHNDTYLCRKCVGMLDNHPQASITMRDGIGFQNPMVDELGTQLDKICIHKVPRAP